METLLDALRRFDALRDTKSGDGRADQLFVRTQPSQAPDFAPDEAMAALPGFLRDALGAMGINRLYAHQAEAIRAAANGEDIVLESPTASGKTLCFNLPLVMTLVGEINSNALMLFPMKALANDQRRQFEQLTRGLPTKGRHVESWLYDGDTDVEHKALIRKSPPAVLLTNPEYLHQSFLGWSEHWVDRYLKNLRFLVIDEIHEYRGYFGTNFALLLRRFLAKLSDIGSRPQLILATATCANPMEHAQRLTGRTFTHVRETRGMRPQRDFAFINPDIPDYRFHDIYQLRIARAALACVEQQLSTVIFCPTRKFAEDACRKAQRDAPTFGLDPAKIVPYRSGYDAQLRRDIEQGLRDGKYQVVFSTNALEIGIDIGRLDACILAGFPDNVMSAWQRLGRAGRSWERTANILFFAMNSAVDQFYVANIDTFLERQLDEIIIGIDNEELIGRHIPYVLHEAEWKLDDARRLVLGPALFDQAKAKAAGSRPMAGGRGPNYMNLNIRGGSGTTSKLLYHEREIGTISDAHQFREAYVGAVFNQFGKSYRVKAHGAGEVLLEDAESHLRTEPKFFFAPHVTDILKAVRHREAASVHYGKLTLFENYLGYRLIDERTGAVLDDVAANEAKPRHVRAFWLALEKPLKVDGIDIIQGLRVVEQFLRIGSSFIIPCDRHDVATLTTAKPPQNVYFYETVPGGIGVGEKMFEVWRTVMEEGMKLATKCKCDDGCPRCIYPPRCSKDGGTLSKRHGLEFAKALLSITDAAPEEVLDPDTGGWRRA